VTPPASGHRISYANNCMSPPSYRWQCYCGETGPWLRDFKKVEAGGRQHINEVTR
jgi:hypothetical protein